MISHPTNWATSIRGSILTVVLSLGILSSVASVYAFEKETISGQTSPLNDPIESLSPEALKDKTIHISQKSDSELLRSYLTLLMCEIPGLASFGPVLLNGFKDVRDTIPILGPIVWSGVEWIVYQTFFSHYTGGESAESCQAVMDSLYVNRIGSLLNYSVEAYEKPSATNSSTEVCQVCQESIQAISEAVETLAGHSNSSKGRYEASSARMKPTAVAIKVSGLVTDPYLFKRASENLISNRLSPFRVQGSLFPSIPASDNLSDPLSSTDHIILQKLMNDLRETCRKAKAADIVVMIDAEYSWFQPALDRIATFLSAEFNTPIPSPSPTGQPEFWAPTVFNTFQALLRSTPSRLQEFVDEAQEKGYSIGIKLVRGAYLVSETNRWREERLKRKSDVSDKPLVWSSKAETDECFDSLASSLVNRLSNAAKKAQDACQYNRRSFPENNAEVSLMIAGHNPASVSKILRQLRDREGLAKNQAIEGVASLSLSGSLRGRIMFAQLYGMADNLTTTLTQVLSASDTDKTHLQPFVFKYLPFGPVEKVLPYLARRAEENQSILSTKDNQSGITFERKLMGKEIRKRAASMISGF